MRKLLVLPLVLVAACGASKPSFAQPKASSFHEGACRSVAAAVLSLGRDAHTLSKGTKPDPNMAARLNTNQDTVYKATDVSATEKVAFDKLVLAVGIVRIRNDSNTYNMSLAAGMVAGYDSVISTCTGKG